MMEGISNQEKNEKVPTSYLEQFKELTGDIVGAAVEKAKGARTLAALSLLSLGTVGCQSAGFSGGINTEVFGQARDQIGETIQRANEYARNDPSERRKAYEYRHTVRGSAAIGIRSDGTKIGSIKHRDRTTIRTVPGTMAHEQEKNRQEAIAKKNKKDNK